MGDLLDDFTGLLPDWAQTILQSDPVSQLAGAGATFGLSALGFGNSNPGIVPPRAPGGTQFSIGGPMGISFSSGGSNPNPNNVPLPGLGGGPLPGNDVSISYSTIRSKMYAHLGFKPRRKTVVYLIRVLGFAVASAVLGLDVNDVLWLFTHRRHGSRRHYVQTMLKTIRRAEGYRKQLGRVKVPGAHHRRRPGIPAGKNIVAFRKRA